MAGIYIHIPFCKKACIYCNFHFSTSLKLKDSLIEAILKEIDNRQDYLEEKHLNSIYFGGGTPSFVHEKDIEQILEKLSKYFSWDQKTEITLEANPDDLDISKIKSYLKMGINRLSIGIQSFFNEDLQFMGRAHDSDTALKCIHDAQNAGIPDLNVDLIYGSPTTTEIMWEENLNKVTSMNIPHISAYALTVEEKTALHHHIKKKKITPLDENKVMNHFSFLMDFADSHGYEQYEISNFSKPGKNAVHNSNYWKSIPYLGLGPSAHSYNLNSRCWNISNNAMYITNIKNEIHTCESEYLGKTVQYNEFILTRLRTKWGVNLNELYNSFGNIYKQHFYQNAVKFLNSGLLHMENQTIYLSRQGKYLADKITSELFYDLE